VRGPPVNQVVNVSCPFSGLSSPIGFEIQEQELRKFTLLDLSRCPPEDGARIPLPSDDKESCRQRKRLDAISSILSLGEVEAFPFKGPFPSSGRS